MTKAHNQQRVTSHITLNEAISVEEKQLIKTERLQSLESFLAPLELEFLVTKTS